MDTGACIPTLPNTLDLPSRESGPDQGAVSSVGEEFMGRRKAVAAVDRVVSVEHAGELLGCRPTASDRSIAPWRTSPPQPNEGEVALIVRSER
jgi:hypothetical protein